MQSPLSFFKKSYRDTEQLKIDYGWNGPRNYKSFGYGIIEDRPYWLMRDLTSETSEFKISFDQDEYIGVNVAFKEDGGFWFDNDTYLHMKPDVVEEALARLFEFVLWDAIRKNAGRIYGSFSYNAGWGYTNEPILKALEDLGFLIHHHIPTAPFCLKVQISDAGPFEHAWINAGITDRRTMHSYGYFGEKAYYFISLQLEVPSTYNYRLQINPKNYCTVQCQTAGSKLVIAAPNIHLHEPALYYNLIEHIVFDAIHQNLAPRIEMVECKITHEMANHLAPRLDDLEFEETLKIHPTYRLIL
jgi:hypothetical protein